MSRALNHGYEDKCSEKTFNSIYDMAFARGVNYGKNIALMDESKCEWVHYDYRTICPKNHDANNPYWRIPENTDKLKYCPYCGKEIVVVE